MSDLSAEPKGRRRKRHPKRLPPHIAAAHAGYGTVIAVAFSTRFRRTGSLAHQASICYRYAQKPHGFRCPISARSIWRFLSAPLAAARPHPLHPHPRRRGRLPPGRDRHGGQGGQILLCQYRRGDGDGAAAGRDFRCGRSGWDSKSPTCWSRPATPSRQGRALARLTLPEGGSINITAPVAGLVSTSNANIGNLASGKGEALFSIIVRGEYDLIGMVPAGDHRQALGQPAGRRASGRLRRRRRQGAPDRADHPSPKPSSARSNLAQQFQPPHPGECVRPRADQDRPELQRRRPPHRRAIWAAPAQWCGG